MNKVAMNKGVVVGHSINHGAQVTATVVTGSAIAVKSFVLGLIEGIKGAEPKPTTKPVAKKVVRRTK